MIKSMLKKIRLLGDERGATLVEFGLVAAPFFLMLLGIMDLGYRGYVDTVSKSVLHKVARDASTGEMTTAQITTMARWILAIVLSTIMATMSSIPITGLREPADPMIS